MLRRYFHLTSKSVRSYAAHKKMHDMSIIDEDRIRLSVRAGHGGLGILRYNGIGGDGGDVYMVGWPNFNFRQMRKELGGNKRIQAGNGENALYTKLVAKRGEDAEIHVPVGIEAIDPETNILIARCKRAFHRYLIARGGQGGCADNHYQYNGIGDDGGDVYMVGRPNFSFRQMRDLFQQLHIQLDFLWPSNARKACKNIPNRMSLTMLSCKAIADGISYSKKSALERKVVVAAALTARRSSQKVEAPSSTIEALKDASQYQ